MLEYAHQRTTEAFGGDGNAMMAALYPPADGSEVMARQTNANTENSWALREIVNALRGREHTDDEISEMEPEDMFDEFCEWHGLVGYGETLRETWDVCRELGSGEKLFAGVR